MPYKVYESAKGKKLILISKTERKIQILKFILGY